MLPGHGNPSYPCGHAILENPQVSGHPAVILHMDVDGVPVHSVHILANDVLLKQEYLAPEPEYVIERILVQVAVGCGCDGHIKRRNGPLSGIPAASPRRERLQPADVR